jgi:hypothetical protein
MSPLVSRMTSVAPSPGFARTASRGEAGTLGATGQTLRRAGRFSPFSAPPCLGRPDQVVVIGRFFSMTAFPVGAATIAPLNGCAGGHPSFAAGTQC